MLLQLLQLLLLLWLLLLLLLLPLLLSLLWLLLLLPLLFLLQFLLLVLLLRPLLLPLLMILVLIFPLKPRPFYWRSDRFTFSGLWLIWDARFPQTARCLGAARRWRWRLPESSLRPLGWGMR